MMMERRVISIRNSRSWDVTSHFKRRFFSLDAHAIPWFYLERNKEWFRLVSWSRFDNGRGTWKQFVTKYKFSLIYVNVRNFQEMNSRNSRPKKPWNLQNLCTQFVSGTEGLQNLLLHFAFSSHKEILLNSCLWHNKLIYITPKMCARMQCLIHWCILGIGFIKRFFS